MNANVSIGTVIAADRFLRVVVIAFHKKDAEEVEDRLAQALRRIRFCGWTYKMSIRELNTRTLVYTISLMKIPDAEEFGQPVTVFAEAFDLAFRDVLR